MMRYHYTSIRTAKIKNTNTQCYKDVEITDQSNIAGGNAKWNNRSQK